MLEQNGALRAGGTTARWLDASLPTWFGSYGPAASGSDVGAPEPLSTTGARSG